MGTEGRSPSNKLRATYKVVNILLTKLFAEYLEAYPKMELRLPAEILDRPNPELILGACRK